MPEIMKPQQPEWLEKLQKKNRPFVEKVAKTTGYALTFDVAPDGDHLWGYLLQEVKYPDSKDVFKTPMAFQKIDLFRESFYDDVMGGGFYWRKFATIFTDPNGGFLYEGSDFTGHYLAVWNPIPKTFVEKDLTIK